MNNLQIRLIKYSAAIYKECKALQSNYLTSDCLKQVIRSSTSVGANYSEAQSASSIKDFHNKIRIALKELKETHYWIKFIEEILPYKANFRSLESETIELLKILGTISLKSDPKRRKK